MGLAVLSSGPAAALTDQWTSVGTGSLTGISGLATADSGWVIVRDNKKPTQNHLALLGDTGAVTPLTWPGAAPVDLESIDAVPAQPGTFVAVTSRGQASMVTVSGVTVTVVRQFAVPLVSSGVEAFALTASGSQVVAVWAKRGSTTTPAKVYAATFDPATGTFGPAVSGKIRVPYPTTSVRQVSDLKVYGGRLLVASTSDPGTSGPFVSAVYDAGAVSWTGATVSLQLSAPTEMARYDGHKVEGLACGHGIAAVGSDDEKAGGATRSDTFCA